MEIILKEDVLGVGDIGQTVKVRGGYARNFLVPKGLAVESGAKNAKRIAHEVRQIEAKKNVLLVAAQNVANQIEKIQIELSLRVGKGGKIFGSISTKDISEKLKESNLEIDRRRVLLEEPIRKVGTHFVSVKLHPEVKAKLKVVINRAEASKEEEERESREAKANLDENLTIPQEESAEDL